MAKHTGGNMGEKHTGRHHQLHHDMKRASGGGIGEVGKVKEESYAGTGSDVEKEAERKRGGRMKRARGGAVHKREPMMVEGHKGGHRLDRPGRKRGGAVGADSKPFTSAHKLEAPEGMASNAYGTHLGKEAYSSPMSAKTDREDD